MSIRNHIILKTILFSLSTNLLSANISGIVFQDLPVDNQILNTYGIKDSNELGIEGITVTAYPEDISTVTDANGSWSLNTLQDSRVEFSNIPSYLKESANGDVHNASVQFISNGTTDVTFGLHNPADFSNTVNPLYVTNLQQNGTHIGSTTQNLQTVHYDATGLNADYKTITDVQGTGEIPQDTIFMESLGSVWGKAYQKNRKRLFVASMLQRHVGFANTPADIYVTDYSLGLPPTLLGNFSLQGKIPSNGGVAIDLGSVDRTSSSDHTLYDDPLQQNIDLDAYAKVGKISYGGIDIDHHSDTLWLINLYQKGVISIDVSGEFNSLETATTNQYLIENLPNAPSCSNGHLRPWALKIHEGKGYIGTICDGSISKSIHDLSAHILSFDLTNPALGFSIELNFPLNYTRQVRNWYAWEDSYFDPTHPKAYNGHIYSQPILSDIEFDKYNNIYLAFFDRYSTQLGTGNYKAISGTTETEASYEYGEVLKICNNNGTYEKEGTGSCLQSNYNDLNVAEFFNDQGGDRNRESSLGALALLKGSNQLLLTTTDPHPEATSGTNTNTYWFTQGTHTLSTIDGSIENWYSVAYTGIEGLNAKANGLGDIELISDPAPIEIGDRIWLDTNADGIQDANETGISNIEVQLICGGSVVSSALTDGDGNYIFSNDSTGTSTSSHQYNIPQLIAGSNNCVIRVPDINGSSQQTHLAGNILTIANIGEGGNSNLNDSDALLNGNSADIAVNAIDIPIAGANNHGFDIGFKPTVPLPTYTLGDRVWLDSNQDGLQDANESGVAGVSVNLYNSTNCSGDINLTTITNDSGLYRFNNLLAGDYCIAFSNLPADYNITLANQGGDDSLNSDANSSAMIGNITLIANTNEEDMGIYPTTIIGGITIVNDQIHTNGSCECHSYETNSAPALNDISIVLLTLLTSFVALLFRKELESYSA